MRLLAVLVLGGLGVSLLDRVHVAYGVLVQNDASLFGQAWWVAPVFAVACAATVGMYGVLRRRLALPAQPWRPAWLGLAVVLFAAAYAATGPFGASKVALPAALLLTWLARVVVRGASRLEVGFALTLAILGPLGEAAWSQLGLFRYLAPDLLGVPIWLGGIYLHAGPLVTEVDAWVAA